MDFSALLKNTLQLIASKKFAAAICLTCALTHLASRCPAQFPELSANAANYLHYIDFIGFLSLSSFIVSLSSPHLRHFFLKRSAIKKVKQILQTPGSDEYNLIMLLYSSPDSTFNLYEPIIQHLHSFGILYPTGASRLYPDDSCVTPFCLSHTVRQYMQTHCKTLPHQPVIPSIHHKYSLK